MIPDFALCIRLVTLDVLFVQELDDELVQAGAESVGGLITEFLPEVSHRDDGFGHRPVSSRTADV